MTPDHLLIIIKGVVWEETSQYQEVYMCCTCFSSDRTTRSQEPKSATLVVRQPLLFYFITGIVIEADGLKGKLGEYRPFACVSPCVGNLSFG